MRGVLGGRRGLGFTRSLARQVGVHGIRVNSVMPGAIRTEAERETFPDEERVLADLRERQCLPYLGTAPDLAGVFVYLASRESDFVTGQVITVDGGWVHY
jgi:3-oxoacyl-[acyl-carrier protein] reductase